ncbi:MAG: hypothetical protein A2Y75_07465 [Candidatus Solincola sediminis]|uniref:Uncharacterized protein n=1 Tax=Candidatus Solincola sediminis TaxID=1797199 RepID=A0A1F2WKB2_9ACTN|nr:MAG: hypothetical protein A2Y75_07465 [Candidatus Solincola sediminis]
MVPGLNMGSCLNINMVPGLNIDAFKLPSLQPILVSGFIYKPRYLLGKIFIEGIMALWLCKEVR